MKYLELEHDTHGHVRIELERKRHHFNFQAPIGGEWVDFHALTNLRYGLETEYEAFTGGKHWKY